MVIARTLENQVVLDQVLPLPRPRLLRDEVRMHENIAQCFEGGILDHLAEVANLVVAEVVIVDDPDVPDQGGLAGPRRPQDQDLGLDGLLVFVVLVVARIITGVVVVVARLSR